MGNTNANFRQIFFLKYYPEFTRTRHFRSKSRSFWQGVYPPPRIPSSVDLTRRPNQAFWIPVYVPQNSKQIYSYNGFSRWNAGAIDGFWDTDI